MDLPASLSWRLEQALPENARSEGTFADLSHAILTHYSEVHRAYHNLDHLEDLFRILDRAAAWHELQSQRHAAALPCGAADTERACSGRGAQRGLDPPVTSTGAGNADNGAGAQPAPVVAGEAFETGRWVEEGRRAAPQTEQRQSVQEPPAGLPVSAVLAAFFHDIVYDPRRGDNEEASAALAADLLRSAGVGKKVRPVVYKP